MGDSRRATRRSWSNRAMRAEGLLPNPAAERRVNRAGNARQAGPQARPNMGASEAAMNADELIAVLQGKDPSMDVVLRGGSEYDSGPVGRDGSLHGHGSWRDNHLQEPMLPVRRVDLCISQQRTGARRGNDCKLAEGRRATRPPVMRRPAPSPAKFRRMGYASWKRRVSSISSRRPSRTSRARSKRWKTAILPVQVQGQHAGGERPGP